MVIVHQTDFFFSESARGKVNLYAHFGGSVTFSVMTTPSPGKASNPQSPPSIQSFFSSDRLSKYGFGVIRLAAITYLAFTCTSSGNNVLWEYITSCRILAHVYIGSIGALVNVKQASLSTNIALLTGAAILIVRDIVANNNDYSLVIYLVKTFSGDFLAGKLDTTEWKLALFFTFALLLPMTYVLELHQQHTGMSELTRYTRIFLWLFLVQLICEYGDAHYEHYTIFRHRYSFEILTLALLFLLPQLQEFELQVIRFDLVICTCYRLSNFVIILWATNFLSNFGKSLLMRILGVFIGKKIQIISSPEWALAVLKSSNHKGFALEKYIASPAWLPILSLESVDGDLYTSMRSNFDILMKELPEPSKLQEIATRRVGEMVENAQKYQKLVDADVLARLTVETFCEYLGFGDNCGDSILKTLVQASWEWRKEISVRGKADVKVKNEAIRIFLQELLPKNPRLLKLFGEENWRQSQYYSLIMQPFLISPTINTGDAMIAVKLHPEATTLEQALRIMHPFPIFERFVHEDVYVAGHRVVRKDTQCFMFTSDFANSPFPWPIFGAGLRSCAGMHFANIFLKTIFNEVTGSACSTCSIPPQLFQPELGHRYSGRQLDGVTSFSESIYFAKCILHGLISAHLDSKKQSGGM